MVIVPMYDTLGDEGIIHIVNQSKLSPPANNFNFMFSGFCLAHIISVFRLYVVSLELQFYSKNGGNNMR